jgi:hypothetical protein
MNITVVTSAVTSRYSFMLTQRQRRFLSWDVTPQTLVMTHQRFGQSSRFLLQLLLKRLRWSRGSVLAFGTHVRGFAPGQSRRIFRAKKSSARLPSSVPCRSSTVCKRSLNVTWNSPFRQNLRDLSRITVPPSATGCSRVVTRVETPGGESWNV